MSEIVKEAMEWIGTPYVARAAVKGAGADCVMFPVAVYGAVTGTRPSVPSRYSVQWHLHHDEEKYLAAVLDYATPVEVPQPGDFVLWKIGRCFSHGGIVVDWPLVVHAHFINGVTLDDAEAGAIFRMKSGALRERRFFRPKGL